MTERHGMVGWFDPLQLLQTGVQVANSTAFGRYADFRLLEALAASAPNLHDYSAKETITIDYVADTGDGWDSTYAVARAVSQPSLTFPTGETLPRGEVLIFGGDEVYPVASRLNYEERLVAPYAAAGGSGDVFAIAGNHDWYDGLVSFTRLFCGQQPFAGWNTLQSRSYFAIKLPHRWWLLGTDVQLGSDIDVPQLEYFRSVAKQMDANDQLIICNAEPYWTVREKYGRVSPELRKSNLDALINTTFQEQRVRVLLAGDSHHYQRHVRPDDGQQRIIAGGGGAFLHLTNGPNVDRLDGGAEGVVQKTWPTRKESDRLSLRILAFPFVNPRFGNLTSVVYVLLAWSISTSLEFGRLLESGGPLFTADRTLGPTFFWGSLVILAFVLFTDTHSTTYRVIAGALHGLANFLALLLLMHLSIGIVRWMISSSRWSLRAPARFILASVFVYAGAWLAGGLIMGVYLWISLRWLGHHQNEASSALRNPHWKNFLRLTIGAKGELTIYAIGLRRVETKRTRATPPEIIEVVRVS